MNNCYFIGRLREPVDLSKTERGINKSEFYLEIEEYRKNKNGQKTRATEVFLFEAWDTAALTISQRLFVGDLIAVECTARDSLHKNNSPSVYFRVNNFRIFNKEKFHPLENK